MPEGWAWCRLRNIGEYKRGPFGSSLTKSMFVPKAENTVKVYEQKNAIQKDHSLGEYYITRDYFESQMQSFEVFPGDILVSCAGTIGETYILPDNIEQGIINQALMKMKITSLINTDYFLMFFDHILKEESANNGKGTAIKNIPPFDIFKNFLFPLPSYSEQKRIIESVNNIFSIIDNLENNKSDLQSLIKNTKSKILDLAIHGKLVPQDLNDEPAEELLKRIATSDNRPYKKFDDEVLFDIPETWAWCTGNDLFNPMTSKKPEGETFKYIDIDAIDNKKHCVIKTKTLAVSEAPSRASRKLNNGDVLFSLVRPYLENIALIEEKNSDCIASTGFYVCKPRSFVFSKFLFYLMTSEYVIKGLNQFMKGDNSPSISGDDIKNWRYPLPPLTEQYRIVTKIEELFSSLDIISSNIE